MNKKLGLILGAVLLLGTGPAFAVPAETVIGVYTVPGGTLPGGGTCPTNRITPCFTPVDAANPFPVTGGSSGGATNLTGINGVAPSVGSGTTDTGTLRVTLPTDGTGVVTSKQGTAAPITAGWPVISGEPADTTGTFTNGTQSTAITTASADGYETATITVTGTYGTATGTFQASDDGGTTFFNIRCSRTDSAIAEAGYTSLTNTTRAWFCPVHGFDSIRVQSSAVASGTINVHISESSPSTTAGATVGISSDSTVGVEGADGSTQAGPTNGLPVTSSTATSTDASGTVATGGTFQSVFTSSTARKSCQIQNPPTATENLTVRQGATTQYNLVPGAIYTCNWGVTTVSDQIFVTAMTATHAFSASSQ